MKLVVHIGNGKTGTTSIQQTLEKSRDALETRSICYLGRMLEFGRSRTVRDWQSPAGAERLLHEMDPKDVEQDVKDVLTAELGALQDQGFDTAVWSNEALFARHMGVIDALKALQADGVDVSIVVYLRRHDKWARSAYAQWGIRHKSYQGKVKTFAEWIANSPVRFGPNLAVWNEAFSSALYVKNFDAVGDVVQDFLRHFDVSDVPTHRVYETPAGPELLAHAAFNDRFSGVVFPDKFHRFSQSTGKVRPDAFPTERVEGMFPSSNDLDQVLTSCSEDIAVVNEILKAKEEPVFNIKDPAKAQAAPDTWSMVTYLLKLNFELHERITRLEKEIAKLKE